MKSKLLMRPLTARSAILSVLLGAHPPTATAHEVVAWGAQVGIADSAVRMALSRMVGAGDLVREGKNYTLAPRLIERQRRQDEALTRPENGWNGRWHVAVVTTAGNDAPTRANLRTTLSGARFGSVREGVWMRPNNLHWQPPADVAADMMTMQADLAHTDAGALASTIFDLPSWSQRGTDLLELANGPGHLRHQITVAAAIVRHLATDPLIPSELEPDAWPGDELRHSYATFRDSLIAMRSNVLDNAHDEESEAV